MTRSSMIAWLRDPESTEELDRIEVCRVALEVAGRLLGDYPILLFDMRSSIAAHMTS
jgi:hypothetical protein